MSKPIILSRPDKEKIEHQKNLNIPGFSVIIPSFKRPKLLMTCLKHILNSKGINKKFKVTIYIVDGTPPGEQKNEITKNVKKLSQLLKTPIYLLIETGNKSIVNSKQQATEFAREDGNELFLIIDSDVFVDRNALNMMINLFRENKKAAFVSGVSYWKGGKKDGKLCKPELILDTFNDKGNEVKINKKGGLKKAKWAYISAIHGVFFAIYKKAYYHVGGYNILFPNHGENVELSAKCWRNGFPLVYSHLIKAQHESESAASIMRAKQGKVGREKFILSTPVKMLYTYHPTNPEDMDKFYEIINKKWIDLLFGDSDKYVISDILLTLFSSMLPDFVKNNNKLDFYKKKAAKDPYNFMPYAVLEDKNSLKKCLRKAEKRLKPMRGNL